MEEQPVDLCVCRRAGASGASGGGGPWGIRGRAAHGPVGGREGGQWRERRSRGLRECHPVTSTPLAPANTFFPPPFP